MELEYATLPYGKWKWIPVVSYRDYTQMQSRGDGSVVGDQHGYSCWYIQWLWLGIALDIVGKARVKEEKMGERSRGGE